MNINVRRISNSLDVLAEFVKVRKDINKFSEVINNFGFETIESNEHNVSKLCKIST